MGASPSKAFPLGGRWPEGPDEGAMIGVLRSWQGSFAAPAASFFLDAQKEAKEEPGVSAIGRRVCAAPASMPLTPRTPILRERQLGSMVRRRKGAGGSVDTPPLVFRSRSLGGMRESGTPLFESAFVAVGLKLCGGERRAGEDTRPYGRNRTGSVGSAMPGAAVEPHHSKFSAKPAPSGAEGIAESHSDFARRKFSTHPKG